MEAYVHRSDGRPMIDPGSGWSQSIEMDLTDASVEGSVSELPADIMSGQIQINDRAYPNEIPLPLNVTGNVLVELILDNAHQLHLRARHATVRLLGNARFIENFP